MIDVTHTRKNEMRVGREFQVDLNAVRPLVGRDHSERCRTVIGEDGVVCERCTESGPISTVVASEQLADGSPNVRVLRALASGIAFVELGEGGIPVMVFEVDAQADNAIVIEFDKIEDLHVNVGADPADQASLIERQPIPARSDDDIGPRDAPDRGEFLQVLDDRVSAVQTVPKTRSPVQDRCVLREAPGKVGPVSCAERCSYSVAHEDTSVRPGSLHRPRRLRVARVRGPRLVATQLFEARERLVELVDREPFDANYKTVTNRGDLQVGDLYDTTLFIGPVSEPLQKGQIGPDCVEGDDIVPDIRDELGQFLDEAKKLVRTTHLTE
jgi:hypothetical protein